MTTPTTRHREPVRGREIAVAVLLLAFAGYSIFLGIKLDQQRDCLQKYIQASSDTSTIRSEQVEAESQATRKVIQTFFSRSVTTDKAFDQLGDQYAAALDRIDRARAENPVVPFDPDRCSRSEAY